METDQDDLVVRWQTGLQALVHRESTDRLGIFQAATQSLARLLGYRFAGVGILDSDGFVQLACFWNADRFAPTFRYRAEGTPCNHVFTGSPELCHFDRVTDRFPADPFLRRIGAQHYRGILIKSGDGEIFGHIFAIHDEIGDPSSDAAILMPLIAQWCGREVRLDRTMSQLREKHGQLQEALTAAERANTSHRAFLANVSHELRTPLNAVVGFSEALTFDRFARNADTVREYAQYIGQSAKHLLALIDDLLDIAAIESGHLRLKMEPVDVAVAAQEAIALTAQAAERKGLTIDLAVAGDAAQVRADRVALRQILINLLSNAVKNTGEGGSVAIGSHRRGDVVAVTVRDTGIGIPQESLARILQPFQRVETGFSRRDEGTGLGLSIASRLTEAMGGRLAIESELGLGTTVTVELARVA